MSDGRRRGVLIAVLLTACTAPTGQAPSAPPPPLHLEAQVPGEVFPGGRIDVLGDAFLWGTAGETVVWFDGSLDDRPVAFDWPPLELGATHLRLGFTPAVRAALPAFGGRLTGQLRVELHPADQPGARRRGAVPIDLTLRETPRPALTAIEPGPVAPGQGLTVAGADFVDGDEGRVLLELEGRFTPADPAVPARTVQASRHPLVEWRGRTQGVFAAPTSTFGLAPGRFEGRARLVVEGPAQTSTPWLAPVTITFVGPELPAPPPATLSRGAALHLDARGALPLDAAAQTSTRLRLRGEHRAPDGTRRPVDLDWVPDDVTAGRSVRLALRTRSAPVEDAPAPPPGPGWSPGVFTGDVELVVRAGREELRTPAVPWTLTIAPDTQHVLIDVRPGFTEGLALFGLAAAETRIVERIVQVCARDFAGLRVHCGTTPPPNVLEFVTVELGGQDPNGLGLFGLEASPRKDSGNRRLDERIGGHDPETDAHGGVFVSSFLALSPGASVPSTLADPAFDDVFAPFSPALSEDAQPYDPETDPPGTERATRADDAVRALGALVGSTVTHELGHALGLSAASDAVHNPGDWPLDLMDAGEHRPFAERAELGDHPPARFTGPNAVALARLLGDP